MEDKNQNDQNLNNSQEKQEDFSNVILNEDEVWQTSKYGDLV